LKRKGSVLFIITIYSHELLAERYTLPSIGLSLMVSEAFK